MSDELVHWVIGGTNRTNCGQPMGDLLLCVTANKVTCTKCVKREPVWRLYIGGECIANDLTLDNMGTLGHWANHEAGRGDLSGLTVRTEVSGYRTVL